MMRALITLEHVDVVLDGQPVLRDLNWQLQPGKHWAIVGANGSGKSTLLMLLRGDLWPAPGRGRRIYNFDGQAQATPVGIREQIGLVSPELQERYLQQDWSLTGRHVVQTGFFNSDYLCQKPSQQQNALAADVVRMLGIGRLLAQDVQK